jgi:cytochrome P450
MNSTSGGTAISTRAPTRQRNIIPTASIAETMSFLAQVMAPTAGKGVIIRRRAMMSLAEGLNLDRSAVKAMQRLRNHHGRGPLMLRIPMRRQAVVLHPDDVRLILEQTPEPFATATMEKRAALGHFEPGMSLVSHGADRADRRRFNEDVLQHEKLMHDLAENFVTVAQREAGNLLAEIPRRGILSWDHFAQYWFRIVRQVVFGAGARDDHELRDMLDSLRSRANWAYLAPQNTQLRARFLARVRQHLARAEEGSLAAMFARIPKTGRTAPEQQVPQYLFAFDPAGMTTFRALALLAAHRDYYELAREEANSRDTWHQPLPMLRAAALEALRLWPTTPLVLRETTRDVEWETGIIPARTGIVIFAPFFHRDEERLAYANRFAPEIWIEHQDGVTGQHHRESWPLVPFSRGPGVCPGRNIVLLVSSAFNATVLKGRPLRLAEPARMRPDRPLPASQNHFSLRFELD